MAIAHYVSNGRVAFGGLVYCVLTYGIGFVLGTIRVLLITPKIGPIFAVMLGLFGQLCFALMPIVISKSGFQRG
jgi:hypothetical protein